MRTENRITDILLSECPRFYLDKIPSLLNGCWRGTNQRHLSKKLVLLALLVCEALSASCFLFLTETSCFWLRLLMHTSWDISTAFFSFSLMLSLRASSTQTRPTSLRAGSKRSLALCIRRAPFQTPTITPCWLLVALSTVCMMYANVVRSLLTEWRVATGQILNIQYGCYPGRNTLQPMFILRH